MITNTEIIFIDDDTFNNLLAERLFKKLHIREKTEFFDNGEKAIAWWKKNKKLPSVILLDQNMPSMTGLEMLQVLVNAGADFSETRTYLMLSADVHENLKTSAGYDLINGLVDRPLTESKLREILPVF